LRLQGFNRIYDASLTAGMYRIVAKHAAVWRNWHSPAGNALPDVIKRVRSIRQFDETITVHSFGEWQDNLGAFG
jgi:predicted alpha/beta-fold hydrolase